MQLINVSNNQFWRVIGLKNIWNQNLFPSNIEKTKGKIKRNERKRSVTHYRCYQRNVSPFITWLRYFVLFVDNIKPNRRRKTGGKSEKKAIAETEAIAKTTKWQMDHRTFELKGLGAAGFVRTSGQEMVKE